MAAFVAVLGLAVMKLAPPFATWTNVHTSMLTLHLLLELFAVIIAALVVVVAWNAFGDAENAGSSNVMLVGFMTVAMCDLVHALVYEGMPPFLSTSGTPRAIFFWLMGRTVEVMTLGLVALGLGLRVHRVVALALGTGLSALLLWVGSYRLDLFPVTFVPGQGVTAFKAGYEYVLTAANFLVALVLWHRAGLTGQGRYYLLAMSCFMVGLGGLAFTSYQSPSDFANIFGHVYKVIAYALLYMATFHASIGAPFRAVQESERRARESEARLRALGNNLPGCVVFQVVREADASLRFLYISDAVERMHGVKAADALADPALVMKRMHPDDLPRALAAFEESARSMLTLDIVGRVRSRDGQWRWTQLYSAPRVLEDGRTVWDGVELDITDKRAAEESRRALESKLREAQKMEAIGTLAGGIAHDFNNVLGSLLGNLALAREDVQGGRPERAQHSLDQAHKAGLRARALVRQILTFSRRQPQALHRQPMRPLVEDSLAMLRATLPARVSLDAALGDADLHVLADTTQMEQVVMNLCTNAWQALRDGAGRIVVGLEAAWLDAQTGRELGGLPAGEYVHLWVRDDGVGIRPEALGHIFEPFFTTKPAGQGTGLGLSVVHGIVRAHHGAISVESAPGKGSTFHVYLPSVAAEPQQAGEAGVTKIAHERCGRGEHVAYVDDDELMELMVVRLLEREGFRVSSYRSATLALAALRAQPQAFDLLVTDYNMPEMSGLELAEQAQRLRPGLPVILSSGFVSEDLLQQADRAAVRAVLQKENTLEELGSLIRDVLQEAPRAASAA